MTECSELSSHVSVSEHPRNFMGSSTVKVAHRFIAGPALVFRFAERTGIMDQFKCWLVFHRLRVSLAIVSTIQPWPKVKGKDRRAAARKAAD